MSVQITQELMDRRFRSTTDKELDALIAWYGDLVSKLRLLKPDFNLALRQVRRDMDILVGFRQARDEMRPSTYIIEKQAERDWTDITLVHLLCNFLDEAKIAPGSLEKFVERVIRTEEEADEQEELID